MQAWTVTAQSRSGGGGAAAGRRHDGHLDYGNWRHRTWLPAIAAAGLPNLQFHDLRRTAATALVQEQIDIKTAQTRLGHADARTTLGIYAQAARQADRDAADRLGVRFSPPASRDVHEARGMDAG